MYSICPQPDKSQPNYHYNDLIFTRLCSGIAFEAERTD